MINFPRNTSKKRNSACLPTVSTVPSIAGLYKLRKGPLLVEQCKGVPILTKQIIEAASCRQTRYKKVQVCKSWLYMEWTSELGLHIRTQQNCRSRSTGKLLMSWRFLAASLCGYLWRLFIYRLTLLAWANAKCSKAPLSSFVLRSM